MHGAGLGEGDVDLCFGVEEFEKWWFFGVVRLGGVAGSGADALILFVDELGLCELSGALDAP